MVDKLNEFLTYLKKTYPLPKSHKNLLVDLDPVESFPNLLIPGASGTGGYYYPLVPTKKKKWTGLICIATKQKDPINALAHEYMHAHQDAEGRIPTDSYDWDLEIEAITFARIVTKEYRELLST